MLISADVGIATVCPRCHGPLRPESECFDCSACAAVYPTIAGITDFRMTEDPWISLEDDRAKARRLEAETAGMPFEDIVRAYWRMTPETPAHLATRFTSHVLGAEQRSRDWIVQLEADGTRGGLPWLDLGCGTADLSSAAPAGIMVVGIDIALRWLVVARRRLSGAATAPLFCADAAHLPFEAGSFGRIVSLGMLEHCQDSGAVFEEAARVLAEGGRLALRTTNRYTLLREPHVGVWGVGWMPRRWADGYVRMWSGQRYLHHRPLSAGELGRGLRRAGFRNVHIRPAAVLPNELARMPRGARLPIRAYETLCRIPAGAGVLTRIAPLLQAEAVR